MNNQEYANIVLKELEHTLSNIDIDKTNAFVELLNTSNAIFSCGAGRSGFMVKGFAMRLMHMDKTSYVVGETCTPNITKDDVLVICSGSGKTASLVNYANKAKEIGAKIVLVTINVNSTIADMADIVIEIPAVSPKSDVQGSVKSIQPMGSLFEQSEGIYLDIVIMLLMEKLGYSSDTMFTRHANLE